MYSLHYKNARSVSQIEEHDTFAGASMRAEVLMRRKLLLTYSIRSPHGTLLEAGEAPDEQASTIPQESQPEEQAQSVA